MTEEKKRSKWVAIVTLTIIGLAITAAIVTVGKQMNASISDGAPSYSADAGNSTPLSTSAPAEPQVLLDVSGSGIQQTQKFDATNDWTISYTYDCSSFGYKGNFQIAIYDNNGLSDIGANDLGMSGANTNYFYDRGEHYLSINSECSWHVTVKG